MSLRAAVVGLGAMGRHHARILAALPGVELVACCDTDEGRAREHAELRGCRALTSTAELPADLDAVVVAVPTSAHRAVAEPLLARGTSCLVEKPIASDLEEADALIEAARIGGATLAVGHSERFNPALASALTEVRDPLFVEGHRLGVMPERSLDVDVVLDIMIHDLDLLLWLTGSELVDVDAIGVNVLTDRVDIANARLTFASGCTANLTASRVSAEMTRKLRFFREASYVSVDLQEKCAELFRLDPRPGHRPAIVRETRRPSAEAAEVEPLRAELERFLGAVKGGGEVAVSGDGGRRALAAALQVLASMRAQSGRRDELRRTFRPDVGGP